MRAERRIEHVEELLAVPFIVRVESIQLEDGTSTRRVSYPELGGIAATGLDIDHLLDEIDRRRREVLNERFVSQHGNVTVIREPLR